MKTPRYITVVRDFIINDISFVKSGISMDFPYTWVSRANGSGWDYSVKRLARHSRYRHPV